MENTFRDAVREVLLETGRRILSNPRSFVGAVSDLYDSSSAEVKVLCANCTEEMMRPVAEAASGRDPAQFEAAARSMESYLRERRRVASEDAYVVAWGVALGVADAMGVTVTSPQEAEREKREAEKNARIEREKLEQKPQARASSAKTTRFGWSVLRFFLIALIVTLGRYYITLPGCSSPVSSESAHVVYKVQPIGKITYERNYDTYEVVFYNRGKKDENTEGLSFLEHKNDILTRIDDEYHFPKDEGWTEDEVKQIAAETYPEMESLDFVTKTVADKGDVYCIHVKFDSLRNLDNLQAMVDNGVLIMTDDEAGSKVDGMFSAGSIINDIRFSGGHELTEEEVEQLGLHYGE